MKEIKGMSERRDPIGNVLIPILWWGFLLSCVVVVVMLFGRH
jgi:hypothetical protein